MNPLIESVRSTFLGFHDPLYLLLLLLVPLIYFWETRRREPSIIYPSLSSVRKIRKTWKTRAYPYRTWLKLFALVFLILG
ncbi:hypothetical protein HOF92_08890, partial [bacterium]|nr:hypothetical protein [bacterium]